MCVCVSYLAHVFFSHSKLVVPQQERPDLLPDFVLNAAIINQPEQLQLLIVLHTHTHIKVNRHTQTTTRTRRMMTGRSAAPERKRINNASRGRAIAIRTEEDAGERKDKGLVNRV